MYKNIENTWVSPSNKKAPLNGGAFLITDTSLAF
jgi:hypothetical protein